MIHIIRILLVIFLSITPSYFGFVPDQAFFNTIFAINGIFCSIGYSVIISFDLTSITSQSMLKKIRDNLKKISSNFTIYLALAAISFLFSGKYEYPIQVWKITIFVDTFLGACQIFCLAYFVVNYHSLLKLKDEILDKIREEREKED